jgi:hypothetical protein
MRICIDSSVFIRGITSDDATVIAVLNSFGPTLTLSIPRLVALEVTRNLRSVEQIRVFYRIFEPVEFASIIDEVVPHLSVAKYIALGLRAKGDAFIGAFAEWQQVSYLISDNRHFLRQLPTDAFQVLDPANFLARWSADTL